MARWRSPLAFGPLSTGATQVTGSPRAARYGRQPARRLWTALVAAQVVFAVIFGAFTAADVLPSAAGQETTAYAYDVAAYTYDAPALLSSQSATTTDVRGSPSGPAVVSWGRSASTRCCCSAANSGRTVAMGRNMADRVIPYAQKNGYDWYKGTPGWVPRGAIEKVSPRALERTDLWFNKRWIKGEMRNGSRIMDIGEPPGYPPSTFYNMERQQVSGYWNYFQDFQP